MKLEAIQELWNRDREIDYTELGTESIRIPQIHDKYLKIYTDERIKLKAPVKQDPNVDYGKKPIKS